MREILRRHHISFRNAWAGLWWALTTQPNFRVHLFLSAIAIIAGFWYAISPIEMTIVVFTIVLGLASEMINTSIESMTDLITTEYRKEAKIAKDVAAGMMLMVSMGALVVATLIFLPRIWPFG